MAAGQHPARSPAQWTGRNTRTQRPAPLFQDILFRVFRSEFRAAAGIRRAEMENLDLDDLQRAIAELKSRLVLSIRQPTGRIPGHFADLVRDIETLEGVARQIGSGGSGPRGGRRKSN